MRWLGRRRPEPWEALERSLAEVRDTLARAREEATAEARRAAEMAERAAREAFRTRGEVDKLSGQVASVRAELDRQAEEGFVSELVHLYDAVWFAQLHARASTQPLAPDEVVGILEPLRQRVLEYLSRRGVHPTGRPGAPFDPHRHEAVGTAPVPPSLVGRVVGVERDGFAREGKVLRFARVVVGTSAPAAGGEAAAQGEGGWRSPGQEASRASVESSAAAQGEPLRPIGPATENTQGGTPADGSGGN